MKGLLNPKLGACILVLTAMVSCMELNKRVPMRVDGELVSLKTQANVRQNFLLVDRENPSAVVILFPGGQGTLKLKVKGDKVIIPKTSNFLVRSHKHFVKRGFIVALMDAPIIDGKSGLSTPYRMSPDHAQDMDKVVRYLKRYKLPIWVIGTSRGSISAVNAAKSVKGLSGLILTSSVTRENKRGPGIIQMGLGTITIPTLVVSHKDDGCHVTPASDTPEVVKSLTASSHAKAKYFSGGREVSHPCRGKSHHGFLGIEKKVVKSIARFISNH